MFFFSKCLVAIGLFQCAFTSPTYHSPIHPAVLRRQEPSSSSQLTGLINLIAEVDPTLGATVATLVSDLLAGVGSDVDEATEIFSALLT